MTSKTLSNKGYCTFASLQDDSKGKLEDLQEALTEYIEETYNGEVNEFTESESVIICEDDPFLGSQAVTETFSVPKAPIVIKSVKVTKF